MLQLGRELTYMPSHPRIQHRSLRGNEQDQYNLLQAIYVPW